MKPTLDQTPSAAVADGGFVAADRGIAQALEEYLSEVDAGRVPNRQAFLAAHPDIADDLAKCLDGLAFIEKASPQLQTSAYVPAPLPEPAGEGTLGDYRLIREIGRGGMGIVYEAEQISLCRRVALKVLPFASTLDHKQLQRFKNEAHAAAQLHHTNIVPVFATGCERSVHFYAMQYIEGQTLAELIREARGEPQEARDEGLSTMGWLREDAVVAAPANADTRAPQSITMSTEPSSRSFVYFRTVAHIGIQVAEALEHAHQVGIIHRDIKPGNLLIENASLASQPTPPRVWITDFGLAHCQNQIGPTMTGDLVGTLRYMSPEQALGKRVVMDQRTDIYSLGATLFELLTLQPPFDGQDRQELLRQIAFEEPRPPRQVNKNVPRELDIIVLKALEKNPADRYSTAQELADDLRRFLEDQPIHARRATLWQKLRKWCRRHKPLVWTGLAFSALLLGAVATLASWAAYTSQRQLERIQEAETSATHRLYSALVAQARANRLSRRPGQRFGSLEALREAARIARELDLPEEKLLELRNEAIACLLLPDFEVAGEWEGWPIGSGGLAFDASFERYARGDKDGNVSIRRVADDRELFTLPGVASLDGYGGLEFSPDGRALHQRCVIAGGFRSRLWRLDADKLVALVDDDHGGFAFGPQGKECATSYPDGSIWIYDTESGREMGRWQPGFPKGSPVGLFWNPRRPLLAAIGKGNIWVINTETGSVEWKLPLTGSIAWADWHPDGRLLAVTINRERKIYLWDIDTKKLALPPLEGHKNDGLILRFDPSGERLLSSDWWGTWRLWDVHTGRQLLTMPAGGTCLQFNRGDSLVAADAAFPRLRLFRYRPGQEFRTLVPSRDPRREDALLAATSAIDPQGRLLAVSTHDGIALLDVARGEEIALLPLHGNRPLIFEPSGELLTTGASGLLSWPVRFDSASGRRSYGPPKALTVRTRPEGHGASSDGRVLAILSGNPAACVLHRERLAGSILKDTQDQRLVRLGSQEDVRHCAVSPDGAWVATGTHHLSAGAGAKVWNTQTGDHVADLPVAGLCQVGFSPDGKWLATTGGGLRLWHVGSWEPGPTLSSSIRAYFAFSPDSSVVAVEDDPGIVRLMAADTGRELARLMAPVECRLLPRCFTPDGRQLIVFGNDFQAFYLFDLALIHRQLADLGLDWDTPSYRELKEKQSPEPLKVEVILRADDHIQVGRVHAQQENWVVAAGHFAKAFELEEPERPLFWFEHAYLRLQVGDHEGYQKLCRRMHERHHQSKKQWASILVAHTCVLAPGALDDPSEVVALAEQRLARTGPKDRWSHQVAGFAYYRAGKYEKAATILTQAVKDHPDFPHNLINWLILSMAYQQMNHSAEAQQWLAKAVQKIDELQPRRRSRFAPQGWEWYDWLGVQLLRSEAEQLVTAATSDQNGIPNKK